MIWHLFPEESGQEAMFRMAYRLPLKRWIATLHSSVEGFNT
jgi:hypothetical protein